MPYKIFEGFGEIASQYDLALIDLWGVVHDGTSPYSNALDCLDRMRTAGIERILLSNAPRRADAVRRQIGGIGVPASAYDGIVSSGEITYRALRRGIPELENRNRFRYIGPPKDAQLLAGLEYQEAAALDGADFLLVTGFRNDETETVADYETELQVARNRDMPLICANPDLSVMRGPLTLLCAGALAAHYASIGGHVVQFGKPYAPAYDACIGARDLPLSQVVAVGDSPRTDIAGANAFGIDAVFVAGGLYRADVGDPIDEQRLNRFLKASGTHPIGVLPALQWSAESI
ncbi:MAG: TIGR01459 family HAD-type hydrolase [Proteobacteria bacterium]|nr:TIGR01459 family HAD-type hydrolase [Pseudomonadota bacterium]